RRLPPRHSPRRAQARVGKQVLAEADNRQAGRPEARLRRRASAPRRPQAHAGQRSAASFRQALEEPAMIHLHYWPTPNGKKVTILLEELGIPYEIVPCNIGEGDQFKEEFLKIGPNNLMPAMVDDAPADGGGPISVFESGAIMMYLAEKAGRFYPQ